MRTCKVFSPKVTHSGRHAGIAEAYNLGLDSEHIRHLGRWVIGQMEDFYAPKNPMIGAFYMAHFNKREEPYFIERDLVAPPLPLQRLIFPWIESNFDKDDPEKATTWPKECDAEMEGHDPNNTVDENSSWTTVAQSTATRKLYSTLHTSDVIDRISFLKLLVRSRRVILQDAVLFMETKDPTGTMSMSNYLLESFPNIFSSQMFLDFKAQLLCAIEERRKRVDVLDPTARVDNHTMVHAFNSISKQIQQLEGTINNYHASLQEQINDTKVWMDKLDKSNFQHISTMLQHIIRMQSTSYSAPSYNQDPMDQFMEQQKNSMKNMLIESMKLPNIDMQTKIDILHQYEQVKQLGRPEFSALRQSLPSKLVLVDSQDLHNLSTPSPSQLQPQPQQPRQLQQQQTFSIPQPTPIQSVQPSSSSDNGMKGYILLSDNGKLTIRQAWDEYHYHIIKAKELDPSWPYTQARKRAYQRRKQFIELIKQMITDDQSTDALLDDLSRKYNGRTINSVREEFLKNQRIQNCRR